MSPLVKNMRIFNRTMKYFIFRKDQSQNNAEYTRYSPHFFKKASVNKAKNQFLKNQICAKLLHSGSFCINLAKNVKKGPNSVRKIPENEPNQYKMAHLCIVYIQNAQWIILHKFGSFFGQFSGA